MEEIEVSIIMLSYNHENYIKKAILSVLSQKIESNIEIIIGDDCSTDNSSNTIMKFYQKYPNVIIPVIRKKNIGASNNFYDLLRRAKGTYIAILECDDFWIDSNKLRKQIDFLKKNKFYSAVYGEIIIVNKQDEVINADYKSFENDIFTLHDFECGFFPGQTGTCVFRNFISDQIENYSIIYEGHSLICDRTLLLIFLKEGKVGILSEKLSAYRKVVDNSSNNACSIMNKDNMYLEQWDYYDRLDKYAKQNGIDISMDYLLCLTFVQSFDRFLKRRGVFDLKTCILILRKSGNMGKYLSFLTKVIFFKIRQYITKKSVSSIDIYWRNRKEYSDD